MLRVYHLFIGAILLVFMPVGAKFVLPHFSNAVVDKPSSVTTPAQNTPPQSNSALGANATTGNIWQKILGSTPTPDGWLVAPCEGTDNLLCVSSQKKLLGTVEIGVYPVKNHPDFQKNLSSAGIPLDTNVNYQSPEYQKQLLTALKTWVADFETALAKDRQVTYKNDIVFSAHPPQQTSVGTLTGVRYGFVGIKKDGAVQEQNIGHVAFDGTNLYVITTAFDPGAVTGKFERLENLAIFQPYLAAIADDLQLPVK
jgi:hypothetical protein